MRFLRPGNLDLELRFRWSSQKSLLCVLVPALLSTLCYKKEMSETGCPVAGSGDCWKVMNCLCMARALVSYYLPDAQDSAGVRSTALDAHSFRTMDSRTNILCINVLKMGKIYRVFQPQGQTANGETPKNRGFPLVKSVFPGVPRARQ